jgi:hypothetical protein
MANEKTNSPRDAAVAVLAKAQKLLNKKTSPSMDEVKTEDLKKSAEFTSGLHTVEYHGLESSKYSTQQAALAVLAKAQDMLSETISIRSDGLQKSAEAESGMHRVEYYGLAKKEVAEEIEHLCEDHKVKKDSKAVSKAECMKCEGFKKSEFSDLYADLEDMAKSEGQGAGNKKAPSNDLKPKIEEKPIERDYQDFETKPGHAPENDHREAPQAAPQSNPKEQHEGNNPPAGAIPADKTATGATPGTGKKGVHKLSFFMGHCHSKKSMKKGIALG